MSLFKQTTDGDLDFSSGGLIVLADPGPETAQRLSNRFNLVEGEWVFDTRQGFPYYSQILGSTPSNFPLIESLVRRMLLDTPGVDRVLSCVATEGDEHRECVVTWQVVAQGTTIVGDTSGAFIVT